MDDFMHYGVAAGVQAVTDSGIDFSKADPTQLRRRVRRRHRRAVDHRERLRRVPEGDEPAQDLAVLRARDDHQHDLRAPLDPLRPEGPEPRRRHRLHHLDTRDRARRCAPSSTAMPTWSSPAAARWRPRAAGSAASARRRRSRRATTRPQAASRPWDKDRDGFVLCDGGGAVLLEELEHAQEARRAHLCGTRRLRHERRCASHHRAPGGRRGRAAGHGECAQGCGLNATDVQYINAHATSTPLGDKAETIAMKRAFGDARQEARGQLDQVDDRPPARRRRRGRGDLLGPRDPRQRRPADHQLPHARIRSATSTTCPTPRGRCRSMSVLSNSFGFGGTNGSLIFRRFSA